MTSSQQSAVKFITSAFRIGGRRRCASLTGRQRGRRLRCRWRGSCRSKHRHSPARRDYRILRRRRRWRAGVYVCVAAVESTGVAGAGPFCAGVVYRLVTAPVSSGTLWPLSLSASAFSSADGTIGHCRDLFLLRLMVLPPPPGASVSLRPQTVPAGKGINQPSRFYDAF